ncbi:unnamed protein product, partial [Linum tenue]
MSFAEVLGETNTDSLLGEDFMAAISSRCFHEASRLDLISSYCASFSWNFSKHSLNSS